MGRSVKDITRLCIMFSWLKSIVASVSTAWGCYETPSTFLCLSYCREWLHLSEKKTLLLAMWRCYHSCPLCFALKCQLCMFIFRKYICMCVFLGQLNGKPQYPVILYHVTDEVEILDNTSSVKLFVFVILFLSYFLQLVGLFYDDGVFRLFHEFRRERIIRPDYNSIMNKNTWK